MSRSCKWCRACGRRRAHGRKCARLRTASEQGVCGDAFRSQHAQRDGDDERSRSQRNGGASWTSETVSELHVSLLGARIKPLSRSGSGAAGDEWARRSPAAHRDAATRTLREKRNARVLPGRSFKKCGTSLNFQPKDHYGAYFANRCTVAHYILAPDLRILKNLFFIVLPICWRKQAH